MAVTNVDGLISGLDTTALIESLMTLERQSQDRLKTKRTTIQTNLGHFRTLNTNFLAISTAAKNLNTAAGWKLFKANSSHTSNVSATASTGAVGGALSFVVKNLAAAHSIGSFANVASTETVVSTTNFMMGKGGAVGIDGVMEGSATLALGSHTFEVTQASTGGFKSGTALADSITIAAGTLTISIGGTAQTLNLNAGTYTQKTLAAEVERASGGTLDVTVNADKSLKLTTVREGSAATFSITGGTLRATLGLSNGAGTAGTSGIIKLDGVTNTVNDVNPLSTARTTLNSTVGTVGVTFAGGLRVGSFTGKNIDDGDGKLSTVVSAINAAGLGISAAAVQVSPGSYKLQLNSSTTGKVGAIGIDSRGFAAGLGSFEAIQAATDATLTVGSGATAYDITSSSNTATGILPGVTLTLLKADAATTVTVDVARDGEGIADKVKALVDAANTALSFIKTQTKYDSAAGKAAALQGNSTFSRLQSRLVQEISASVAESGLGSASNVGIKLGSDGLFAFDRTVFTSKYATDPESMASLFVEGGTTGITNGSSPGLAERMATLATEATVGLTPADPSAKQKGMIQASIEGLETETTRLDTSIADWDLRLEKRKTTLQRQFSSLEVALSKLRSQSTWLAGQLNSLNRS